MTPDSDYSRVSVEVEHFALFCRGNDTGKKISVIVVMLPAAQLLVFACFVCAAGLAGAAQPKADEDIRPAQRQLRR